MTQIANNIVKFFSEKWPILAIAVVAIVFCFLLYKWLFTPRKSTVQSNSEKNRKRIDKGISYKENQKALQAKIDIAKFWGKLPLVSFTEEDKEELQKLILAVDKRTSSGRLMLPEEIYCQQLFIALAIIFVCVILMFLTPFTILGVLIVPIIMRTPVKTLEGERKDFAVALADEFLSFYKLYFVQFIQPDNTTTLSAVINDYLPNASLSVKKILKVVDSDLAKGEEFALKRFDARFPDSPKVHKFCSVARARTKGDETSYETMKSFLDLLQEEHDVYFDTECKKREKRIESVIGIFLAISLCIVAFMAFAMMFMV